MLWYACYDDNSKLYVFEKNACPPPAPSSVRTVEGRQRTRYDRFETEAFIKVRRTCTYIYMNINKGYHPIKFEGSGSKGTCVIERKQFLLFGSPWPRPMIYWPKINRVLLLNKSNHPMKFEGSGSKGTRVIERKRFSLFGSLWPWPLTYWPQNQ